MRLKNVFYLLFVTLLLTGFASCGDDDQVVDEPVNLILDKSSVSIQQASTAIVMVTQGNGDYKVNSNNINVATAAINDKTITITAVGSGEAKIEVTDKAGKKETISVNVYSIVGTWAFVKVQAEVVTSDNIITAKIKSKEEENIFTTIKFNADNTYVVINDGVEDGGSKGTYTYQDGILTLTSGGESHPLAVTLSGQGLTMIDDTTDFWKLEYSRSDVTISKVKVTYTLNK